MMSSQRKSEFSNGQDWCQARKLRVALCLNTPVVGCQEPLFIIVHQDTLAKDLITVYQSKRYGVFSDDQDRIILRLNGIDLHPNTSVFDISGIFDGVDLHAFYWYPDAGWI